MNRAAIISNDIANGEELLAALDRAKVKARVALWAILPEYEDWRLVISDPKFDTPDLRDGYRLIRDSLSSAGSTTERTPTILILPTRDRFIRELRRIFGKAKSVAGMRLGGQMIGDRFIEDAYVYRIS